MESAYAQFAEADRALKSLARKAAGVPEPSEQIPGRQSNAKPSGGQKNQSPKEKWTPVSPNLLVSGQSAKTRPLLSFPIIIAVDPPPPWVIKKGSVSKASGIQGNVVDELCFTRAGTFKGRVFDVPDIIHLAQGDEGCERSFFYLPLDEVGCDVYTARSDFDGDYSSLGRPGKRIEQALADEPDGEVCIIGGRFPEDVARVAEQVAQLAGPQRKVVILKRLCLSEQMFLRGANVRSFGQIPLWWYAYDEAKKEAELDDEWE